MKKTLDSGWAFEMKVEGIRAVNTDDEDYLLGTATIFNVPHHFQAIRVFVGTDGLQRPTRDPHGRFEDLQKMDPGYLGTTKIPAFEGDWVVYITPFVD